MIVALVSHYLTNKLIMRRPFPKRRSFNPKTTCGIRHRFRCLSLTLGYVPTCYSAVRRSSPEVLPLDLHVLGTPPAFILSQDQTLQKRICLASVRTYDLLEAILTLLKQFMYPVRGTELTLICTAKFLTNSWPPAGVVSVERLIDSPPAKPFRLSYPSLTLLVKR